MRKNLGAKPLSYPQPVFIIAAYGADGVPSAMNAAWAGITNHTEITMCLDRRHKTVEDLRSRGAFTVSMGTAPQVVACDYVGIVSGHKVPDKFARAGFHATPSESVDAPLIDELPLALECRLISYDEERELLTGKIVNVSADEYILDERGKVNPHALRPIVFDPFNNTYLEIEHEVGKAFKDGAQLK